MKKFIVMILLVTLIGALSLGCAKKEEVVSDIPEVQTEEIAGTEQETSSETPDTTQAVKVQDSYMVTGLSMVDEQLNMDFQKEITEEATLATLDANLTSGAEFTGVAPERFPDYSVERRKGEELVNYMIWIEKDKTLISYGTSMFELSAEKSTEFKTLVESFK